MVATFTVVTEIDPQEEVRVMRMYQRLCRLMGDRDGARQWEVSIAAYAQRHGLGENTERSVQGGAAMP
jgi:hypothetical protein